MLEMIFVIFVSAVMVGVSVFGWWYENFGPDKEEENK